MKVIVVDAGDNDLSVSGVYKAAQNGTTTVKTYTATVNNSIPGVTATLDKQSNIKTGDDVKLTVKVANPGENGKIKVAVSGATANQPELTLTKGQALNEEVSLTNVTGNVTVTLTYEKA